MMDATPSKISRDRRFRTLANGFGLFARRSELQSMTDGGDGLPPAITTGTPTPVLGLVPLPECVLGMKAAAQMGRGARRRTPTDKPRTAKELWSIVRRQKKVMAFLSRNLHDVRKIYGSSFAQPLSQAHGAGHGVGRFLVHPDDALRRYWDCV